MTLLLFLLGILPAAQSHIIMTYPGWRGDNLITNETFPYGMQWIYPCLFPQLHDCGSPG